MKLVAMTFVGLLAATGVARAASWSPPVDGPVVRPFLVSGERFARGQHRGVDLAAPRGSVVRSACRGRVRFAGAVPGGGRTVSVGCGGFVVAYQHLRAMRVRGGQVISSGTPLGTAGRSGRPRPGRAHVHFGVREASSGRYVDPLALLGSGPRASPPVVSGPRVPTPLGRAPRPGTRLPPGSVAPAPRQRRASARGRPRSMPLVVWIGLAAFGLGLPLGGLVHHRRRGRRAAKGVDVGAQVA